MGPRTRPGDELKIAKPIAEGIRHVEIVVVEFVVALMMFAPYLRAQVEHVDSTIGNVGVLLVSRG
jgi:hypothetical protein